MTGNRVTPTPYHSGARLIERESLTLIRRPDWLALWLVFCTWCSLSGWILSALRSLNGIGYALSFLLLIAGIIIWRRSLLLATSRPLFLTRRTLYTRHLLPNLWLILLGMSLLGGLLYHPDNYDYLTYRFPRLLDWLSQGHWYWIQTPNPRQNTSSVGIEWLMAPLFLLFASDRLFFLINFISYLFLPGLAFSVFRKLGVSDRVCWWWMWILPAGFCYALQAGSMGNDMIATTFFLASIYYLFEARRTHPARHLILSCLAIALMTGIKASNIPLVIPWLAVLFLSRETLWAACRPFGMVVTVIVASLISYLPMGLLNIHFTGSYTGDPHNVHDLQAANPLVGVMGNGIEMVTENLSPPLGIREFTPPLPAGLKHYLLAGFPRFDIHQVAFQLEEVAGMGVGVTFFTALGLFYGWKNRRHASGSPTRQIPGLYWIAGGAGIAWLGYMGKMGSEDAPRLMAVYYSIAIGLLLAVFPFDGTVVHRRLWKVSACAAILMVFPLLLLYPGRPLLPPSFILAGLKACGVPASSVAKLDDNYRLRLSRVDSLRVLRQAIPPSEKTVGVLEGSDDPGVSLWLPLGSRRVINVDTGYSPAQLQAENIHFVAVSASILKQFSNMTIEDLSKKWSLPIVQKQEIILKTFRSTEAWYLLGAAPQESRSQP